MSGVEPMDRGPAVKPVTGICRRTLFTRDGDEARNEAVIAFAMDRWREAYHRRADSAQRQRKRCLFRLARKGCNGRIVFRCEGALALNEQGPGSDDERAVIVG